MSRYAIMPHGKVAASFDDDWPLLPDLHVPDHRPIDTGIVDRNGDAIMRMPNPIGFGRESEW